MAACMLTNPVPRGTLLLAWRPVSNAAANLQIFPQLHFEGRGGHASPDHGATDARSL